MNPLNDAFIAISAHFKIFFGFPTVESLEKVGIVLLVLVRLGDKVTVAIL